jgi:toxin FitB
MLLDAGKYQRIRYFHNNRIRNADESASLIWARLMADAKTRGQPRSALDTIIAAVAEANQSS